MIFNKIKSVLNFSKNKFFQLLPIAFFLFAIPESAYCQFDNPSQTLRSNLNNLTPVVAGTPNVNLYNGVIDISNELGVLRGKNGAELPISQSYQSSGIKVQDYSSMIGLGWQLSVASSISRNVRGLPDESSSGYFGGQKGQLITQPLNQTIMEQISSGLVDTEPDQFSININGMVQEFVFDKNGVPHFLTQNSFYFVQNPFQSSNLGGTWIIKDILGNEYVFGGSSDATEQVTATENGREGSTYKTFISSWLLKNIRIIKSRENFNFFYSASGVPITYHTYKKNKVACFARVTFTPRCLFFCSGAISLLATVIDDQWDSGTDIVVSNPKYLQYISSSIEKVVFTYSLDRQDLQNGRKLSFLNFETITGIRIKKLEFLTSYRSSDNPTGITYDKRMLLDKVKLYNTNDTRSIDLFSYTYNLQNLPSRNSPRKDHWGYYSENGDWFNDTSPRKGNFKEPVEYQGKACSLESVRFATGGVIKYFFETNKYFDTNTEKTKLGGGLRIWRVEKLNNDSQYSSSVNYSYDNNYRSTGRIGYANFPYSYQIDNESSKSIALNNGFADFKSLISGGGIPNPYVLINTNLPQGPWSQRGYSYSSGLPPQANSFVSQLFSNWGEPVIHTDVGAFSVLSSDTFNDLSTGGNGIVNYSQVTVAETGNGKEVYEFTDLYDYPDDYLQFAIGSDGKQLSKNGRPVYLTNAAPPFSPGNSKAYARGLLKRKTVYDASGNIVDEVLNNYAEKSLGESIPALRCFKAKISTGNLQSVNNAYYNIGTYDFSLKTMVLTSEHKTFPVEVLKNYTYDAEYPLLQTKENTVNSDGSNTERKYFYVKNAVNNVSYSTIEENQGLSVLQQNGQLGVVLGETITSNNLVSEENKIGFKSVFGEVMPFAYYKTTQGVNTKLKLSSLEYDLEGRLISFKDDHSQKNSIAYTSLGGNVKLKAVNAVLKADGSGNELFFENFEQTGNITTSHTGFYAYNGSFQINFTPPNSRNYILTYWFLENGFWKFSGNINYSQPQAISGTIDDVCVYPSDSRISSFTYTNINQISSEINTHNQTTYYKYDDFNRLVDVLDQNKNIKEHYEYNLKVVPN